MSSKQDATRTRVLQLGAGPTALSCLDALVERFHVVGLVRACRSEEGEREATIRRAREVGVPVLQDDSLEALETSIDKLTPECVVVSSHGRILPPRLLEKSRFINVHYAPLPKYRGRANVNWAIINSEPYAGITIHTISPGLDAGNILYQEIIEVSEGDDVASLYDRLNSIQRNQIAGVVQDHLNGYEGVSQDERQATYGCTRVPDDGEIDWSRPAIEIQRLVRALVPPFPGAFTYFQGRRLLIWRAEAVVDPPRYDGRVPGRVVAYSRKTGTVDVLAGEGVVRLYDVQRATGKREPAAHVVTSVRETLGLRTSELLARIEQLERLLAERPTAAC
ncbi:methionyl-tRNA formyltransferase [Singulisphaera sp. Ch08]|uniref:Methionyl-tRNA formyltransferase n=1 Tax=Singulisphaera sp. Ch08 TaxID=3120278 RepID=A0AAU7CD96_9BACT